MFIRFRVHPQDEDVDGVVRVFHKSIGKARRFILGRLIELRPQVPYLVRVVGIGHESGVLTIDLR